MSPPLRTDREKLRTIVRNLVENAIKYTPRGLVTVDARWDRQRDEVEIRVADTGIGIAPAEIETMFEAFRQGSNRDVTARARGGVGLGLYIVQRLASRLGGEVSSRSSSAPGRPSRSAFRVCSTAATPSRQAARRSPRRAEREDSPAGGRGSGRAVSHRPPGFPGGRRSELPSDSRLAQRSFCLSSVLPEEKAEAEAEARLEAPADSEIGSIGR